MGPPIKPHKAPSTPLEPEELELLGLRLWLCKSTPYLLRCKASEFTRVKHVSPKINTRLSFINLLLILKINIAKDQFKEAKILIVFLEQFS